MKIELPTPFTSVEKAKQHNLAGAGGKERVLLVIDNSGSMGSYFIDNKNDTRLEAAVRSIETIVRNSSRAASELGLICFSNAAKVLSPISSSFTGVIVQAKNIRTDGGTHYLAALTEALKHSPNRLIFLSDGQPTDSHEEEILHYCETFANLGIKIDAVGIGEAGDLLRKMAKMTGGVYAYADTVSDLINTFQQLESRARLRLTHQGA